MSERPRQAKLLRSSASSVTRTLKERGEVASAIADAKTKSALKQAVKPNSLSKSLRTAGVALIVLPEPLTAVPGAIMIGASYAIKGKEPASVSTVYDEASKLFDEINSSI